MLAFMHLRRSAAARMAILLAAATVCGAHAAREANAAAVVLPGVEVSALADPVEKSYRGIVSGMDLFARRHALAPRASLRFKLLPRSRDTDMSGIRLEIVGETVNVPVPVSGDNTVTFPRLPRALEEDALAVPNRKAGSMTWRADVRTPGLPPGTRRLGDLRLECLVGMEAGLVSQPPSSIVGELAALIADRGYCDQRIPHYLFFADRPLWSVTLVHGSRREVLSVDDMYAGLTRSPMSVTDLRYCDCEVLLDRTYYAPLGDPRWPDDTLIELEYMDEPAPQTPAPAAQPGKATP